MLHDLQIRKQSSQEEAEESKEMTMVVLKLTEGLGLVQAGIKVFEDTDSYEQ
jgi:hypothetical protein